MIPPNKNAITIHNHKIQEYNPLEISIPEEAVETYMLSTLKAYYNPQLSIQYRSRNEHAKFECYLSHNVYSIEDTTLMMQAFLKLSTKQSTDFYRSLLEHLSYMLQHMPINYHHVSFMGP